MIETVKKYTPFTVDKEIRGSDYEFGNAVVEIRNLLAKKYKAPKELGTYDHFIKNEILLKFLIKLWANLPTNNAIITNGEARDLLKLSKVALKIQKELCLPPYTGYCTNKIDEVFKVLMEELDKNKDIPVETKEKIKGTFEKKIQKIQKLYKDIIEKYKAIPDIDEEVEKKANEFDIGTINFSRGQRKALEPFSKYADYRDNILKQYPKAYLDSMDKKLYEVSLVLEKLYMEPNMEFRTIELANRMWLAYVLDLLLKIKNGLCKPYKLGKYCKPRSKELRHKLRREVPSYLLTIDFANPLPSNEEDKIKVDESSAVKEESEIKVEDSVN